MKYRVYVKEIWVQGYTVEAKSKAHAKTMVGHALNQGDRSLRPDRGRAVRWGFVGEERWDVEPLG